MNQLTDVYYYHLSEKPEKQEDEVTDMDETLKEKYSDIEEDADTEPDSDIEDDSDIDDDDDSSEPVEE